MASSRFATLFLLLITLVVQIHARESQFFSKVTNKPAETVAQETEPRQEEQPEFVPENQSGYGLYGHATGLYPPEKETKSGVQTYTPGTYSSEKYFNNDRPRTEQFQNGYGETSGKKKYDPSSDDLLNFDNKYTPSNNDLLNFDDVNNAKAETFYNRDNNGVGTERYYQAQTQKDNNFGGETYYSNFGSRAAETETNNYNVDRFDGGYTNEVNARYAAYSAQLQNRGDSKAERHGMSDTRFLENGRYFYDVNKDRSQSQYGGRETYNPNYSSTYDPNEFGARAYPGNKVVGGGRSYSNNFDDNSGGETYEFNSEYERSRQNQYDP